MTDPANLDAYLKRFRLAEMITGHGVGNVFMHAPCPFCAAPEWLVFEVLAVREAMSVGAKCKECGRSAKAIFLDGKDGGVAFEIVQMGGIDPPEYLVPKMRRV